MQFGAVTAASRIAPTVAYLLIELLSITIEELRSALQAPIQNTRDKAMINTRITSRSCRRNPNTSVHQSVVQNPAIASRQRGPKMCPAVEDDGQNSIDDTDAVNADIMRLVCPYPDGSRAWNIGVQHQKQKPWESRSTTFTPSCSLGCDK